MTNIEIERQAELFARTAARAGQYVDPEDAWYQWSLEHHIDSPGSRALFEWAYRRSCSR